MPLRLAALSVVRPMDPSVEVLIDLGELGLRKDAVNFGDPLWHGGGDPGAFGEEIGARLGKGIQEFHNFQAIL